MCVIFAKPKDAKVNIKRLVYGAIQNFHGWGLMSPSLEKEGRLEVIKSLDSDIFDILDIWDKFEDRDVVAHFRFRTRGGLIKENVQPTKILSIDDGDPRDLYMVHNGTVPRLVKDDDLKSDSVHLVEDYLAPILKKNPEIFDSKAFIDLIKFIGNDSRFVFMDGFGKVKIINQKEGYRFGKYWTSNIYGMLPPDNHIFRNPLTTSEREDEGRKKKAKFNKLVSNAKLNRLDSRYKYDAEEDLFYRTDRATGEPIYSTKEPDFRVEKIKK